MATKIRIDPKTATPIVETEMTNTLLSEEVDKGKSCSISDELLKYISFSLSQKSTQKPKQPTETKTYIKEKLCESSIYYHIHVRLLACIKKENNVQQLLYKSKSTVCIDYSCKETYYCIYIQAGC